MSREQKIAKRRRTVRRTACNICEDLQRPDEGEKSAMSGKRGDKAHTVKLASLQESAHNGCLTCGIIDQGILGSVPEVAGLDAAEVSLEFRYVGPPIQTHFSKMGFFVSVSHPQSPVMEDEIEFFRYPDKPCPFSLLSASFSVPGDTSSEESYEWFKSCMSTCLQTHGSCNSLWKVAFDEGCLWVTSATSQNTSLVDDGSGGGRCERAPPGQPTNQFFPLLPTRVLDIGGPDTDLIRLCEPQGEKGLYVCLSHCWGDTGILRTTSKTIDSHRRGIKLKDLSKTFQDAVRFARRVGANFIWIDSLCIVQDDAQDWATEAARMATIYENAFLTIAATRAQNGEEGCFSGPTPIGRQFEITGETEAGEPYQVLTRKKLPAAHLDDMPLLQRAWVFQERLLSPRVLHFSSWELIFECRTTSYCQCDKPGAPVYKPDGDPRPDAGTVSLNVSGVPSPPKVKYSGVLADSSASHHSSVSLWQSIVQDYSRQKLTVETDIFPALSGLAKQVQKCRTGKYIAGLWEDSLLEDLGWRKRSDGVPLDFPRAWRAPSWSWASVMGGVCYGARQAVVKSYSRVTTWHCKQASSDPTGALVEAHIVVSGLSIAAHVRVKFKDAKAGQQYKYLALEVDGEVIKEDFADGPLDGFDDGEMVTLLGLCQDPLFETFLVLKKEVEGAATRYRRVGCFRRCHPIWGSLESKQSAETTEDMMII